VLLLLQPTHFLSPSTGLHRGIREVAHRSPRAYLVCALNLLHRRCVDHWMRGPGSGVRRDMSSPVRGNDPPVSFSRFWTCCPLSAWRAPSKPDAAMEAWKKQFDRFHRFSLPRGFAVFSGALSQESGSKWKWALLKGSAPRRLGVCPFSTITLL